MRHSKAIVVAVIAAAFVMAGCSGSDSDADSESISAPPSSTTANPTAATATRGWWIPTTSLPEPRGTAIVFTAGFLGLADGEDFDADVNDALNQLEATLGRSGAGFDTLLKVNVYLTDWNNWETFNRIYQERIAEFGLPPRTTVEVSQLGLDAPIEIAAIAHVRSPAP